jgi:hypothetical protein
MTSRKKSKISKGNRTRYCSSELKGLGGSDCRIGVELEDIFDANSKQVITMHIVAMLHVEPSTCPPAHTLVKEFTW